MDALSFLRQTACSCIVYCCQKLDAEGIHFLTQIRFIQPQAPIVLLTSDLTSEVIFEGINRAHVFRFIKAPVIQEELEGSLLEAIDRHLLFKKRSVLLKESSLHNRELEALTTSLEEMVEQRTKHVEESNSEQSNKLAKERQLIRFIAELSSLDSVEDVFQALRRDLKKFHHLANPILAYRVAAGRVRYWSFQGSQLRLSESGDIFEFPKEASSFEPIVMQALANHLGRPIAKAHLQPLDLRLSRWQWRGAEAFLCFENSFQDRELQEFSDFLAERAEVLGMVLDRIFLEENLETFSWRWEKTFDGMRDPIAIIDMDFNIIRANKKFGERVQNRKCYELFAQRSEPCEHCPAQKALREGVAQVQSIEALGHVFEVHSYPVKVSEGAATTVMHQYIDVTQSRELYLRMLQSEKMGAIGLLAGNIAHELNNPLTGIRSLTQVLLQETENEKQLHSDLVEIEKAALRSQKIIKNLLDFSQGNLGINEICSVDELVEKTMPMLKTSLRMHRLHLLLDAKDVMVKVEPHLIQQVIFNLVNNACQAMKEVGDLTIRTGLFVDRAFIEVEDNGPGIPSALQNKIFEPFFTTKNEGQGTGLGLSLARSVIEGFAGSLKLKNVEPQGACFRIELPVVVKG